MQCSVQQAVHYQAVLVNKGPLSSGNLHFRRGIRTLCRQSSHLCARRACSYPTWQCSRRGHLGVVQANGSNEPPEEAAVVPSAQDGVDWFCYTTLGLLFLTDFTPIGQLLTSSGSAAPLYLAAFQWAVFVAPTANWVRTRGWDLQQTFALKAAEPRWLLAGTLGGPALWLLVTTAINAKAGLQGGLPVDAPAGLDRSVIGSLYGAAAPASVQQWALLLLTTAVSPALAEELLFRGFLLTSLQSRFGRIDAVALSAALFAAVHLSLEQFFAFCVLGFAAGAVATRSGRHSVLPAVLLHCSYNLTAIAAGVAASRGLGVL